MVGFIENAFINKVLDHILDGNKGSNILTVVIAAIVGLNLDYVKAFRGFKFEDMNDTAESAKLVGTVIVALFGYFVGKRKPVMPTPQAK